MRGLLRLLFCCLFTPLLLAAPLPLALAPPTLVRYYYTPTDAVRYAYYYELLDLVLKKTEPAFGPYQIEQVTTPMSSKRWNAEAIQGKRINVMWSNTGHTDLNEKMIPIPIPADRGVHGYRIFLIRAQRQADFDRVRTLEDLRQLTVGQAENWGDVKILQYNAIKVVTGSTYNAMLPMLNIGRFDYFSRSVLEAPAELKAFGANYPDLVIEKSLLLHYKFPVVFFVSKSSPHLADRLKTGLQAMTKDGTLKKLFNRHFEASLGELNLKSRRLIEIENPYLPDFVPLAASELWFDPLATPKTK